MTLPSTTELKKALRRDALARRDALDTGYRIEASLKMAETAAREIPVESGAVVSGFWPIRSEVDVRPLLFAFMQAGARICLPAIIDSETIVFRNLVRGAPMIDMGFATMGPGPEAEVLDPVLMFVPLAAFDAKGNRIGYGAGYYDRAIARLRAKDIEPELIGVAFGCQEVESVPAEPHDVPLARILTETGLRGFADR